MKRTLTLPLLLTLTFACHREEPPKAVASQPAAEGNADAGKAAIDKYGCNACHVIPGVEGPRGMVGPSLEHLKSRPFLAGNLPNNRETLVRWVQNPQAINPQDTMPNLGVTPADAKDIAAYLYAQP
jgi:cytochrome c2